MALTWFATLTVLQPAGLTTPQRDPTAAAAVGAAVENLIIAAHGQGLATMWKTGGAAYDPTVKQALGLALQDHIVGFVHVGVPTEMKPVRSVDLDAVTRWVR